MKTMAKGSKVHGEYISTTQDMPLPFAYIAKSKTHDTNKTQELPIFVLGESK